MTYDPKFSVIIPTFNRARLVMEVIESVLAQTFPAHEIILVDDGSTDGTAGILQQFVESNSKARALVRYLYQQNNGQSVALNNGIAQATGDWLAFGANDDMWRPEKLEWQARAIERNDSTCGACFTDAQYVNNPRFTKRAFQLRGKIEANLKCPDDVIGVLEHPTEILVEHPHGVEVQTLVARKDIVRQIGGFDPKLHLVEDSDFLFRLSRVTGFCFVYRPLVDIDRNVERTDGLTERILGQRQFALEQFEYLYEKWLRDTLQLPEEIKATIVRRLQSVQNELGSVHLIKGSFSEACHVLRDANRLGFNPKVMIKYALVRFSPQLARRLVLRWRSENPSVGDSSPGIAVEQSGRKLT
jgi:glycosyltransferase involved in cell wall biosynthesis